MSNIKVKRCAVRGLLLLVLSFGLSGCFKANFSVDVKSNGSGSVGVAFGITQEFKDFFASQGQDPWQEIEKNMSQEVNTTAGDVKVTRWTEGEYDWVKAERACKDLDEINKMVSDMALFKNFSLTRKHGIFQDEFVLEAELNPMNNDPSLAASGMDASSMVEMSFSARLPGQVVETNGSRDTHDANLMSWKIGGAPVAIKARSVARNWLNLSGVCLGGFGFILFGIFALGGFDAILYPRGRNKKPLPQSQPPLPPVPPDQQSPQPLQPLPQSQPVLPSLPPQVEKVNYMVELNIEDLLSQINAHVLGSAGQLYKRPGEIALVWKDTNGRQRFIDVKEAGQDRISINGEACPAAKENVRSALVSALQKQRT